MGRAQERFKHAALQHLPRDGAPLPDRTATPFSPVKPGGTDQVPDGMRDFFLYRDLRIAAATGRSRQ